MLTKFFFFVLGVYIQFLVVTGQIALYVNIRYSELIFVSGFILTLIYFQQLMEQPEARKLNLSKASLIYLPLLAILLVLAPASLGSSLADNRNLNVIAQTDDIIKSQNRLAINTQDIDIEEWVTITSLSNNLEKYDQKPVVVEGLLFEKDKKLLIGKYSISCCAVDATITGIELELEKDSNYEISSWYKLKGEARISDDGNFTVIVDNLEQIDEPENPYYSI